MILWDWLGCQLSLLNRHIKSKNKEKLTFSLHANVCIDAGKKCKLQKLCRYLMRPPLSLERLYRTAEGEIEYRLKKAWSDGTKAVILSELGLIEKLIAIIPPPKINSVRFFGTLAPNSSWRAQIVPPTPVTR